MTATAIAAIALAVAVFAVSACVLNLRRRVQIQAELTAAIADALARLTTEALRIRSVERAILQHLGMPVEMLDQRPGPCLCNRKVTP